MFATASLLSPRGLVSHHHPHRFSPSNRDHSHRFVPSSREHPHRLPSSCEHPHRFQPLSASIAQRFPNADSTPAEVVAAQLTALSSNQLTRAFELFSPARRAIITESEAGNECPSASVLRKRVRDALDTRCPGLIGHASAEITSGLTLNDGRWRCRVKVQTFYAEMYDTCDGGFLAAAAAAQPPAYFVYTLTRQHVPRERVTQMRDEYDAERGDGKDLWLVWNIDPERRGGGGDADDEPTPDDHDPPPGRELPLSARGRLLTV